MAGRNRLIHLLIAETYLGPKPDGHQVNHRDGNPSHNAAANLEYVTPSENVRHSLAVWGVRRAKAPRNGQARLDEEQGTAIRETVAGAGVTRAALADQYGDSRHRWPQHRCTKHSVARDVKADPEDVAAELPRATMWDVQRLAEVHRYRFGFVENVIEVRKWGASGRGRSVRRISDTAYTWSSSTPPSPASSVRRPTSGGNAGSACSTRRARDARTSKAGHHRRRSVPGATRSTPARRGRAGTPPGSTAASTYTPAATAGPRSSPWSAVPPTSSTGRSRHRGSVTARGRSPRRPWHGSGRAWRSTGRPSSRSRGAKGSSRSPSTDPCVPAPAGTRPGSWSRPGALGTTPRISPTSRVAR
ncbi:HNH endonuclease [Streptomyces sp. NPDC056549]|uniref:HNH endonuclease signature motif containing protein n=1 Tax=Streptomyces sp. NPDC056549 TaxID=3345864 RepID=UPI0036A51A6C